MSGSHTFSLTAPAKIGLSFRFAMPAARGPPECYLQSETKIEPDLRLHVLSSTKITIPNAAKVQLSLENQNVSCPTFQSGLLQTKKKILVSSKLRLPC